MRDRTEIFPYFDSNVYGIGRSILGMGTLLTLAFNTGQTLFRPLGKSIEELSLPLPLVKFSLFSLMANHLEMARWISIGILILVILGWRPRVTGVFHWWITWSVAVSCLIIDGGDQISSNLSLLLIPITLADPRLTHWHSAQDKQGKEPMRASAHILSPFLVGNFFVVRLQVAMVYLHSVVAKLSVPEWLNGTAVYYWLRHPSVGMPNLMARLLSPLLGSSFIIVGLTWGAILIELALFLGFGIDRKYRSPLMWIGLCFHFSFILAFGLGSFFFAMAGALVLYLRPLNESFILPSWVTRLRRLSGLKWSSARSTLHFARRSSND